MPENPTATMADPSAAAKLYTPPNQRNRSLNRRKSGDRLDRANNNPYGNDGEKNQLPSSRNVPIADCGDAGAAAFMNENSRPKLISLEGCRRSEAYQLLNERWAAAMHLYNDPTIDLSERPAMYSGSHSAWGRLPHQMMSSANNIGPSSGSQIDFLGELRRAMQNAKSGSNN